MDNIGSVSLTSYGGLLNEVHSDTLAIGRLVQERLAKVIEAIKKRDTRQALQIARSDYKVNKAELAIDEQCVNVLALYNPKARDLRLIVALTKILVDMERMGDEVQRIAHNLTTMNFAQVPDKVFDEITRLGERVLIMLDETLTAFKRLESQHHDVKKHDHKVDEEWNRAMVILKSSLSASPDSVDSLLKVLWCARSLERMSDHLKNISEYTVFIEKGKDIRHSTSRASKAATPVS